MYNLVAITDFVNVSTGVPHSVGGIITDPDEVSSITGSAQAVFTVQVPAGNPLEAMHAPVDLEPEPAPAQPDHDPDAIR